MDPSMSPFPSFDNTNPDGSINGQDAYGFPAPYLSGAPQTQAFAPQSEPFPPAINTNNMAMSQSFEASLVTQLDHGSQGLRQHQQLNESYMLNTHPGELDFGYQNHSPNSTSASEYDSSLMMDPQMHQRPQPIHQAVNPADLVSPISNSSVSPLPSSQDQQQSPGPMSPPGSTPGTYYTPQHSRHTSLDPATAAYLSAQPHQDWQNVMNSSAAFQGHRRAPSEVSEVSSANHSPFLSQREYDSIENNASPSLAPQNDPALYDNALGIESFTLSEQQQQQQQGYSPLHSPYISPRLIPQQGGEMVPNASYLSPTMTSQFPSADMYGMPQDDMMNALNSGGPDIGQASQMAPPSINVEFAPPSRVPSFPSKPAADLDSLSPPAMSGFNLLSFRIFQVLIDFKDPVCAVNPILMHTLPHAQDRQRLQGQVSRLLLRIRRARYHLTHAVALARATHHHPVLLTDAFRHRQSRAEIISWTSPIPSAPAHSPETQSASRSTQPHSNAHFVRSDSPVHTTCALIYEPTPTSDHSSAQYAARLSLDNTTENATKGYTPAKRNSFVAATSLEAGTGAAGAGLRVQMHSAATSDQKPAEYASSRYLTKNLKNENEFSLSNNNSSNSNLPVICNLFPSHLLCLVYLVWMAKRLVTSSCRLHYLHNIPLYKHYSGIRSLLQVMIQAISGAGVVSTRAQAASSDSTTTTGSAMSPR
jgi:hypothetical protein